MTAAISSRLTLADTGTSFVPGRILASVRGRWAAIACDATVIVTIGLAMYVAMGTLWMPLCVALIGYYAGGILLLGRLGQDVRAAGSGRVVYTGSGLRGYGNLIIIKHGDSLLSSYAHNRELLVHEGQDVAAGQVIAHMGMGPHQISALYFEIRVNGKPTDPLRYLRAAP